jgi:Tol biopolymer transport system component
MKKMKAIVTLAMVVSLGTFVQARGPVFQQTAGELFEKALYVEEGQGDLQKAIGLYQDIVKRFPESREVAAKAQLHVGLCYEKLGLKEAERAFQKVINDFPEQKEAVRLAREKLSLLPGARAALEKGAGEMKIRKVWENALDFTGSPSPDGRFLSFIDWEKFANLGVHDLVTGENRFLTDNPSWETGEQCYQPIFSPDGSQIAYSWQTKEGPVQLRIVRTDGSASRVLSDGKDLQFQTASSWSADGKAILAILIAPDQTRKIAFVSVDDGTVRVVKSMAGRRVNDEWKASLSPDSGYIAYNYAPSADSNNLDIFLLTADGTRQVPLVEHPSNDVIIGWASDGRRLIFKSDRAGNMGIYSIPVVDGNPQGEPQLLKLDVGNIYTMGLSRDGSLFYGLFSGWSDIFVATLDPQTGKVLSPPEKAIRQNEGSNSAPDWSPDGGMLACRSQRHESVALLLRSIQTNVTRELVPKHVGALNFHFLRWSPDGHMLLGVGLDEKGKYGALHAIDIQSGDSEILARSDERGFVFMCEWTPDGKGVYFIRRGQESRLLVRHDIKTGEEVELFRYPNSGYFWFALSPDGRELALASEDKLRVYSTAGGEPRELTEVKEVMSIAWTRDGKYILYSKLREKTKDVFDVWRIPAEGGAPQKLDLAMQYLMHLRVHPDGRRIAFTGNDRPAKSEVWVMENFLPGDKK